jgi:excisionase family DNA binding protein
VTDTSGDRLLKGAEVARMFGVTSQAVSKWAKAGKLTEIRTPGGQYRYREVEVQAWLSGGAS